MLKKLYEAISNNIKYLTLYTFQLKTGKDQKEINFLINLLENKINKQIKNIIKKKIKLKIIGNVKKFPKSLRIKLKEAEKMTKLNNKIQINVALNYGSKEEILRSVKKLIKLSIPINEKNLTDNLYTVNIPDPEILIRTGNRNRLSNFLLWQSSYTENILKKLGLILVKRLSQNFV